MIRVSLTPRNGSAAPGSIEFHGGYIDGPDGRMRILDVQFGKTDSDFAVLKPPGFVSLEVVKEIAACVVKRQVHGTTADYEWEATLPQGV